MSSASSSTTWRRCSQRATSQQVISLRATSRPVMTQSVRRGIVRNGHVAHGETASVQKGLSVRPVETAMTAQSVNAVVPVATVGGAEPLAAAVASRAS